jgi:dimethylhistidine N-methyltransferase
MANQPTAANRPAVAQFAQDILAGLTSSPKKLPSKYFYDAAGDRLFQAIMATPEYYLTDAEFAVFRQNKADILAHFGDNFEMVELGAGDGQKTRVLLEHFIEAEADFTYRPIDISGSVLQELQNELSQRWPELPVAPVRNDWFAALRDMDATAAHSHRVILFLGANIGNMERPAATHFLRTLHDSLDADDRVMIGFDLKKNPDRILAAYNDPAGNTAAFNLNLLYRINKELAADFHVDRFRHWQIYDPLTGACRSRIVSTVRQEVYIGKLDRRFSFDAWEAIEVEVSIKYSLAEIEQLATAAGFRVEQHFQDERGDFVDTLWRV